MIEANNPEINIDELMEKIREEVANCQELSLAETDIKVSAVTQTTGASISYVEALLNNAEAKSQVRTEIPKKLNRFPFNISKGLQKFALKLYAFLFKEQRAINFSLIQALRESVTVNRQLIEQVTAFEVQLNRMSDRVSAINEQMHVVGDRVSAINEQMHDVGDRVTAIDERYIKNDSYLKNDLTQQKRLITLFLEEARKRLPETFDREQLQTFVNEDQHYLDSFYAAFEEQFRGSREEILHKLKVYLPLIEEAKVGTPDSPILDAGCGRGEWLELLRESGYTARGLDINRVMVEQCRARGFEAIESDAIAYLQALPDASLGAVMGFHIIEHLPFPVLIELLNEVARVLQPGGLAVFETPNPQNFIVGACDFYSDPTHRAPIFPETIRFMFEYQGFLNVKLLYLNPVKTSPFDKTDTKWQILHNWFFGARDYAVIGYKL